jgi:hypothetical protein
MTLTIELTPEEERRLEQEAQTAGVDLAQYVRRVLGLRSLTAQPPRTEEEWKRLEEELAEGIDPTLPPLSDEVLSRESLYGHRA